MKKERKPLTTREKVLIGVGVVGACVAGYLGYKYWENLKDLKALKATNDDLIKDLMSRDTEAEIAKKIALEAMDAANNQEVINDITREALEETMKDLKIIKDQKNAIDDLIKDLMSRDTEAEIAKKIALEAMDAANNQEVINDISKEELNFMKYLIVEGDIVPKAIQNGANKIARKEHKINGIVEAISKRPNDESLICALKQHECEYKFMRHQQDVAEELKIMIENDECIYANYKRTIMRDINDTLYVRN